MKGDRDIEQSGELPKWQARSFFFVIMLMVAPVFVLAFMVVYDGSQDVSGLPVWVIAAIVVWALTADYLLSWCAERFGLLTRLEKGVRERLFHAVALAPVFAMIFVEGAARSLHPVLAWMSGIALIVFVMMTAPVAFGWLMQRIRSRHG